MLRLLLADAGTSVLESADTDHVIRNWMAMSIFNYLFDSDWYQRSDIEALKEQNSNLTSRVEIRRSTDAEQSARIAELQQDVGELALLSKTLMRLLLEKGVCTGKELEDLMREIDMEDGVADGRVTKDSEKEPTGNCKGCGRPVQPKRSRCLYCGHEF